MDQSIYPSREARRCGFTDCGSEGVLLCCGSRDWGGGLISSSWSSEGRSWRSSYDVIQAGMDRGARIRGREFASTVILPEFTDVRGSRALDSPWESLLIPLEFAFVFASEFTLPFPLLPLEPVIAASAQRAR